MIGNISIYKSHVIKIVISQCQSYVLSIYLFLFILGKDVSLSIDMSSIIKREKKKKVVQKFDCYVIEINQKETFITISIYKLLIIKLVITSAFSNINEPPS